MLSRNAIHLLVPSGILILVGAVPGLREWMGLRPALSQVAPNKQAVEATHLAQSADEKAIRAVDEVFVSNYNKGDSKALTARPNTRNRDAANSFMRCS